ncbi:hypothetical protein N431DRAFT_472635 [Stipitochalara longipes BDJ]|nr:hypothetical protein N431DRAFT_472635 [Stipitochalara longipes BDJ]
MAASLLNQTLFFIADIPTLTAAPTPTSTSIPLSANQSPQWDAVAVYGFVFGLLAVMLAIPGTYLAIVALKRHREHKPRQYATNDVEPDIEMQTSGLETERVEADQIERPDREGYE